MGSIARRGFEHAGEHCRLGKSDVADRLAEIESSRSLHAVGAAAKIGAVEIELEDLTLGVVILEIDGDEGLFDLAGERALRRKEHVLGELLSERAAALHNRVGARVLGEGTDGAHDVDAEMFEETPVLSGERRLDQEVWEFLERHRVVAKQSPLADLVAESVVEGDAVLVGQVHLALGEVEGGDGEGKHDEQTADAEGQTLAGEVVEDADDASGLKAPEEGGVGAPQVLEADPSAIKARIDARIDREPINKLAPAIAL